MRSPDYFAGSAWRGYHNVSPIRECSLALYSMEVQLLGCCTSEEQHVCFSGPAQHTAKGGMSEQTGQILSV